MNGGDYTRVAAAIRFLEAHAVQQPGLADVAAHVGLSEFHFHRLFKRLAGVTPKDFLRVLTLARAKRLLAENHGVLETSIDVGLSGPSRLHDLFTGLEGMTPGTFRRGGQGLIVRWGIFPTPLGAAVFAATDAGLCAAAFLGDNEDPEANLRSRWPKATLVKEPEAVRMDAEEVAARMRGDPGRPLSLAMQGTPFQMLVWQALVAIPEGRVTTYGALASGLGMPSACRAVGAAVGANPIAYLIPCHRVIRSTGAVGDYRWGCDRKIALLAMEGARHLDWLTK